MAELTRFWKRATLLALLPLAAPVAVPVAAHAKSEPDPVTNGVHVIGDSITHGAHKTVLSPANRPKGWTVDAFPGRRVTALGTRFIAPTTDYWPAVSHMFRIKRSTKVGTVVLALGTNATDGDLTDAEARAMYRDAVRRVRALPIWKPGPKRVVFVTTFRDPAIRPEATNPRTGRIYAPYTWAYKQATLTKAMRHVARNTGYVCESNWRGYIKSRYGWATTDGVHPTMHGRRMWRNLLFKAIRNCR